MLVQSKVVSSLGSVRLIAAAVTAAISSSVTSVVQLATGVIKAEIPPVSSPTTKSPRVSVGAVLL